MVAADAVGCLRWCGAVFARADDSLGLRGDAFVLATICSGRGDALFGELGVEARALSQSFGPCGYVGVVVDGELGPQLRAMRARRRGACRGRTRCRRTPRAWRPVATEGAAKASIERDDERSRSAAIIDDRIVWDCTRFSASAAAVTTTLS
jgi:hypothetical protein